MKTLFKVLRTTSASSLIISTMTLASLDPSFLISETESVFFKAFLSSGTNLKGIVPVTHSKYFRLLSSEAETPASSRLCRASEILFRSVSLSRKSSFFSSRALMSDKSAAKPSEISFEASTGESSPSKGLMARSASWPSQSATFLREDSAFSREVCAPNSSEESVSLPIGWKRLRSMRCMTFLRTRKLQAFMTSLSRTTHCSKLIFSGRNIIRRPP